MRSVSSMLALGCLCVMLLAVLVPSGVSALCSVSWWSGCNSQQRTFGQCSWQVDNPAPTPPNNCHPQPSWPVPSTPHNCSTTCDSTVQLTFSTETLLNTWSIVINCYYLSKTVTTNGGWVHIPGCDGSAIQSSWATQPWASDALVVSELDKWPGSNTAFLTGNWRSPNNDPNWGSGFQSGCLSNFIWAPVWQVSFPFWNCSEQTNNWMLTQVGFPGFSWGQLSWPSQSQCNSFAFTRNCSTPSTHITGDPQFSGLRGQSYQVHGIDGAVYSLISDQHMQLNSRFVFLRGPRPCPIIPSTGKKSIACFAHAGSYLGNLALLTSGDDRLIVQSGKAAQGLASVLLNGEELTVGNNRSLSFSNGAVGFVSVVSSHELRLVSGVFELEVENSDEFLNLRSVRVRGDRWKELVDEDAHGLLGQTWRVRRDKSAIEGRVDDYMIASDDLFGTDFMFNRFPVSQ